MPGLNIENLVRGIATGQYLRKVGSRFGSIWGSDGLMVVEATPEQYAGFGASRKDKLCHGEPLEWLGKEWFVILAYHRGELRQVNIHTDQDDAIFNDLHAWLENILGNAQEVSLPQDITQAVQRRLMWQGRDGVVSLHSTATFVQVSVGRPVNRQESKRTASWSEIKEFVKFFAEFDLWPVLQWVVILPMFVLPIAPLVWLLMVAIGVAPMTWGGFFFNWLVVSVMFEAWFIYKRIRANWNLFQALPERDQPREHAGDRASRRKRTRKT